jgi:hypothetical protein
MVLCPIGSEPNDAWGGDAHCVQMTRHSENDRSRGRFPSEFKKSPSFSERFVGQTWRRGWDLNPRDACAPNGFQDRARNRVFRSPCARRASPCAIGAEPASFHRSLKVQKPRRAVVRATRTSVGSLICRRGSVSARGSRFYLFAWLMCPRRTRVVRKSDSRRFGRGRVERLGFLAQRRGAALEQVERKDDDPEQQRAGDPLPCRVGAKLLCCQSRWPAS